MLLQVQRPGVLETVTVDLYVLRKVGLFLRRFPSISTDVVGLLDEWAARFFEELDYVQEGENATQFAEMFKYDMPQVNVHSNPAPSVYGIPVCNYLITNQAASRFEFWVKTLDNHLTSGLHCPTVKTFP